MKTEWDYTHLAEAYLKRADYSQAAIDAMLKIAGMQAGEKVCDIGAGVAHLTLMLADRALDVISVEPNDEMRKFGRQRTAHLPEVEWVEGVGENTGLASSQFKMVTFGSSFNVCDRSKALQEMSRISVPGAWFAALWNHRDLEDPVQKEIEAIIGKHIPAYSYGTRRECQSQVINDSELFNDVIKVSAPVIHQQSIEQLVEAWRSHATLERQAGSQFDKVIHEIERYVASLRLDYIAVPYQTNIWMAQLRD